MRKALCLLFFLICTVAVSAVAAPLDAGNFMEPRQYHKGDTVLIVSNVRERADSDEASEVYDVAVVDTVNGGKITVDDLGVSRLVIWTDRVIPSVDDFGKFHQYVWVTPKNPPDGTAHRIERVFENGMAVFYDSSVPVILRDYAIIDFGPNPKAVNPDYPNHIFKKGEWVLYNHIWNANHADFFYVEIKFTAGNIVVVQSSDMNAPAVTAGRLTPEVPVLMKLKATDVVRHKLSKKVRRTIAHVFANGLALFTDSPVPEPLEFYEFEYETGLPRLSRIARHNSTPNCRTFLVQPY